MVRADGVAELIVRRPVRAKDISFIRANDGPPMPFGVAFLFPPSIETLRQLLLHRRFSMYPPVYLQTVPLTENDVGAELV